MQGLCSGNPFPSLYCYVDSDGQVAECHDTLFEIDTVYRCGGSGNRFNGIGPGVLIMGYEFQPSPTQRVQFVPVATWAFIGYGYNSPPEDTTYVFADPDAKWEQGFEACVRLP